MLALALLLMLPQFGEAKLADLERGLQDRQQPAATRVLILEELALREAPIAWETCVAAKAVARGPWLMDYVRLLHGAGEPALEELEKYAKNRADSIRAEAIYGLVRLDEAGGEAFATKVLRDSRQPTAAHMAALRGLAERKSILARVEALRQLANGPDVVALEAIDLLARDAGQGDIPYLIDAVERRDGRSQAAAVQLLQTITGYRIGADARSWRYFFLKHETEGSAFRRKGADQTPKGETLSYMGIPVLGRRVVFVLDASGSMNSPLAENTRESRGKRAVGELSELLPRLPERGKFDVVFFESKVNGLSSGRLIDGKPRRIEQAQQWLRERVFDGGTNLFGGLEEAFSHKDVEEVILLTDGMPSVGEVQEPTRILAWVQRWNRWRRVRVSVVGLSAPRQADQFLSKLASQNGGVYRSIR